MALVASGYRLPHATNTQERASERNSQLESVFLPESFCALTKTLPFRLSLDFDSEPERPKLNIDFHFLDLVDNFLLEGKKGSGGHQTLETFTFLIPSKGL